MIYQEELLMDGDYQLIPGTVLVFAFDLNSQTPENILYTNHIDTSADHNPRLSLADQPGGIFVKFSLRGQQLVSIPKRGTLQARAALFTESQDQPGLIDWSVPPGRWYWHFYTAGNFPSTVSIEWA